MVPDDSETGLVERIRNADQAAEAELVGRFYPRVYAMVLARTRDNDVAWDLAQEIMLAVLCALREGGLRDHGSLTGYVCVTARNRINYFFRSRRIERNADPPPAPALERYDPEKNFLSAERRRLVLRAIEELRPTERKILRLTMVEGLKPREIAARLGLTQQVVRARKARALRKVQKVMRRKKSITNLVVGLLSYGALS